ncbi:MAG: hypothetical protein H6830_08390 [Planctomycetes bacterium]|nr:hypothetical protein [Planctomycetota bacterium]MCB9909707.1 hypothetical protein [Planctomycetota bacterium]MCB9911804.1 hypothetical protein [Planctomycetota bacterium]HPF14066.1 hypothetical protein [Planctomycetota bacterium]HRV79917.1 hypothetical protein [Planctomycetota bacterium]
MPTYSDVARLDGEAKALLLKILERYAYRQRMVVNVMGHGLKYLPGLDDKRGFLEELDHAFHVLAEIERMYDALGGVELINAIRPRMERIPYPDSRQELAVGLSLVRRAARVSALSFQDCISKDFAALSKTVLHAPDNSQEEEARFQEFAQDSSNRVQAQKYWDRWLALGLLSLGRPGAKGDALAVSTGIRKVSSTEVVRNFLAETEAMREACGLDRTELVGFGIQLPEDLRGRYGASGLT